MNFLLMVDTYGNGYLIKEYSNVRDVVISALLFAEFSSVCSVEFVNTELPYARRVKVK